MAKVLNPLFSLAASGRFGNIVYETGPYGPYVRVHVPQRKKPTAKQLEQNYRFGICADKWRLLSDEDKRALDVRALPLQLSGFNLFIREEYDKLYGLKTD